MSLSLYTDDRLPKIPNDGYCHAILEDGAKCNLKTDKFKKEGKWVYAKWCPQHNTPCKRYYETYKDSCIGFKNFKCSKTEGTRTTETAKKSRIKECMNDRQFFESRCYHESKRDRGHLLFLETLQRMFDECGDIIEELPIEELKKSTADISQSSPTQESLASKISKLSLSVETEQERKKRLESKKEKTLEYKKLQKSIQIEKEKEKRKELEKLQKESLKQKEKENEEKLNEIFVQIQDPKNKPFILEKQNLLIQEISGLIDDEDFEILERTFKSIKNKRSTKEQKGSDKIYSRIVQEYNTVLDLLPEIKLFYPKFKEIKSRVNTILPLEEVQLLQNYLKILQQFHTMKKQIDNRLEDYQNKVSKETYATYKTKLDEMKIQDNLLKSDLLSNLQKKKKDMSDKDYEGKVKITNLVFQDWDNKFKDIYAKLYELESHNITSREFLQFYNEFILWREKKFVNIMELSYRWGI